MTRLEQDTLCKMHDFLKSLMLTIEEKIESQREMREYKDNVIDIEQFRSGEVPF